MQNRLFSFLGLLTGLIEQAPKPALTPNATSERPQKIGTTIRLSEDSRRFFEVQAENLGVSIQECIAMTLHAVMRSSCEPQATELDRQVDNFLSVFEAHQIPMTDIPTFLSNVSDIGREDLLSRGTILNKLEPKLLEWLADLFLININWLKGLQVGPTDCRYSLYKNPAEAAKHLAMLKRDSRRVRMFVVAHELDIVRKLKHASVENDDIKPVDVGVIFEVENIINDIPFVTYHLYEDGLRWNYWACRRDIKTVIMFCDKNNIRSEGVILPREEFEQLFQGDMLAVTALRHPQQYWHPDMLVWNDDRNFELNELPSIVKHYKEEHLDKIEIISKHLIGEELWAKFQSGCDLQMLLDAINAS